MINKHIKYDKNACLSNIQNTVKVDNGKVIATIIFDNNTDKIITAVKLNIRGYNSFGETISINELPVFEIVVQDLTVLPFSKSSPINMVLPDSQIRKIDIFEFQTCFEDGNIINYAGNDTVEYELSVFDLNNKEDLDRKNILSTFLPLVDNYPIQIENDWVCCCGTYNKENVCRRCKKEKDFVFNNVTFENANKLVEEHKKETELKTKSEQKKKRKITIFGIIAAVILSLVIAIAVHFATRVVYFSEDAIRADLQGTWTKYNEKGDKVNQLVISEDKIEKRDWNGPSFGMNDTIKWKPFWGEFETVKEGYTYRLEKDGTISCKKGMGIHLKYKKGGSPLVSEDPDFESHFTALKLSNKQFHSDDSAYCTATITNVGKKTYRNIMVHAEFYDAYGEYLTLGTETISDRSLAPGESVEVSVKALLHGDDARSGALTIISALND